MLKIYAYQVKQLCITECHSGRYSEFCPTYFIIICNFNSKDTLVTKAKKFCQIILILNILFSSTRYKQLTSLVFGAGWKRREQAVLQGPFKATKAMWLQCRLNMVWKLETEQDGTCRNLLKKKRSTSKQFSNFKPIYLWV